MSQKLDSINLQDINNKYHSTMETMLHFILKV